MAENNENIENNGQEQVTTPQPPEEPKTFTQDELNALLERARKEGETSGFVKGKTETNAKWEKKASEREKAAKEEAEKQAKFANMSELEKAQSQAKEYAAELQALQDQIALNEQKEETRKLMKDKGLSDVFLNAVLVKKDAEATLANINSMKELLDTEIQKGVEARITTHVPKQNTQNEGDLNEAALRKQLGLKAK